MAKLTTIEGVGEIYAQKLKEAGVETTEALLEAGKTAVGRQDLAGTTGISKTLILKWVNRVYLARIKGISEEYADLLEGAGVDSVVELARRNAENLYAKIKEVNEEKSLVRRLPGQGQIEDWIEQAKGLPRVVGH